MQTFRVQIRDHNNAVLFDGEQQAISIHTAVSRALFKSGSKYSKMMQTQYNDYPKLDVDEFVNITAKRIN